MYTLPVFNEILGILNKRFLFLQFYVFIAKRWFLILQNGFYGEISSMYGYNCVKHKSGNLCLWCYTETKDVEICQLHTLYRETEWLKF